MNVGEFLTSATKQLRDNDIQSARLDTIILLEDVLDHDRSWLLAHPEQALTTSQKNTLNNFITQRMKHMPLAYIRGKSPFYGRYFIVNKDTLTPRPETEAIITFLKNTPLPAQPQIADVGTGSGCIGITAAIEIPAARVYLYDTSQEALDIAAKNAKLHKVSVHLAQQDLLQNCRQPFDAVLANLPYVPTAHPINKSAGFEPKEALFSGIDGLDHYRAFWQQIASFAERPPHVITECLPFQKHALAGLARRAGYVLQASTDYVQHFGLD